MTKSNERDEQTPLMRQYWELKSQVPDALLLFRMGDFYELFGEDAVIAAQILEITLTSRDKNKSNPLAMAGVPHHSISGYIQRLLKAGKKIAIGEQVEDPETVKGAGKIVRREIVRVLTPGVQFDAEGSESNFLAVVLKCEGQGGHYVLACLDASTGESLISQPSTLNTLSQEAQRLPIRHLLRIQTDLEASQLGLPSHTLMETLPKNYLSLKHAQDLLKAHYEIENLETFLSSDSGVQALGILLTYVLRSQQQDRLSHLRLPEPLHQPKSLSYGPQTYQHLDLQDLYLLINKTRSTLGSRQLKRWLSSPLIQPEKIKQRQDSIHELAQESTSILEKLSSCLSQVYDLERICGRINTKLAHPKDTLSLGQSLASLHVLSEILSRCQSESLQTLQKRFHELSQSISPLVEKILRIQNENAPLSAKDGGIFKSGTTPDLDRLLSLTENGQKWLIDLETREREQTGIASLKVRYNRVFGYYIEVTQTHLKSVPAHYQRKQTMVGAERFFTDELKKFEEEILTASSRQKSLEHELFISLVDEIQKMTSQIMDAAQIIADLDSLLCLSSLAQLPGWSFPVIDHSLSLDIQAGRHPVVDQAKHGQFVPNSLFLSPETRLTLLITGPNMGGKSTVMRQTALIIILGQMGAPVPAQSAKWGIFSSIFTRIGAQDAIARGQSTFMVEMSELAHILHYADERSFIILDEIGRGTSTYDGMSVAWASLEWICSRVKARTLFATHYHELIRLASSLPLLANAHMAVESERKGSSKTLRFLYELREGPTNESFGIHVAQLAGLPKPVIERAWKVLGELESSQLNTGSHPSDHQLSLFHPRPILREENNSVHLDTQSLRRSHFNVDKHHQSEESWSNQEELDSPSEIWAQDSSCRHCNAKTTIAQEPQQHTPHPALVALEAMNLNEMTPMQAMNFLAELRTLSQTSLLN